MNREKVISIFKATCDYLLPATRIRQNLKLSGNCLSIGPHEIPIPRRIFVIAFGKASLSMTSSVEGILGARMTSGIVIAPVGQKGFDKDLRSQVYYGAAKNLPDEDSVKATDKVLELIDKEDSDDTLFLFLISGGGSALFCSPDDVTLEEKLATIQEMVRHGATIQELNLVRQRLSKVKGGKTLARIRKAQVASLIISDIVGDPLHLIASGPTITPPLHSAIPTLTTLSLPPAVSNKLSTTLSQLPHTSPNPPLTHIIANNSLALEFLSKSLDDVIVVTSQLTGNASERGRQMADVIRGEDGLLKEFGVVMTSRRPVVYVFGGETTVLVTSSAGVGGRSQEMVLAALESLMMTSSTDRSFVLLSGGTDGQDGPNDAAGAVITEDDVIPSNHLLAARHLTSSDSYSFWKRYQNGRCHLKTGPTGTNVMDIQILVLNN